LTDETTDNGHNGGLLAAESIDISNVLVDDAFFDFASLDEFLIDQSSEVATFLGLTVSLALLAALHLGG